METYKARPDASALLESMRDIGYSIETALADIVDNSITAEARNINIHHEIIDDKHVIAIIDDGVGMSRDELLNAMRPGSQNPLDNRDKGDLGRFGLGLKTASFSQCRLLTVFTRKDGITSCARWDLDFVAKKNDWLLQLPNKEESSRLPFFKQLAESGTVVLWEELDRLTDSTGKTVLRDHINERLDRGQKHLELVFHRFLAGQRPYAKIRIAINGHPLVPFDPYNSKNKATQELPTEPIRVKGTTIKVRAFVLPHHQKTSKEDWEKYGGEDGYLKGQGFYVYREGRLIIHGSWFRLAKKTELTKLARVQVDMPNELDHLWKIDIKKSSAVPPLVVRERLRAVIDRITGSSKRTYTQRGANVTSSSIIPVWMKRVVAEKISYELNRDYPSLKKIFETFDSDQCRDLELMLRTIETSFPVDALFSDMGRNPSDVAMGDIEKNDLLELAKLSIDIWRDLGLSDDEILKNISVLDPIRSSFKQLETDIYNLLGT